ncbi:MULTISPECIES: FUSC family protein [Streptomyces]|uniref:FUSC family protein n=1 Tax=Streptomyces TaxID=1883 RepID=UPI0027DC6507|nr:FUSC family protein [Streptomyces sp. 9-7]
MRVRPLPIKSTVRLRRPVDIWHKPALSAVVALGIPDLTLFALGRLDLALYTSAGAMCALYAHGLPYGARARTLPWVVLGMIASLGVALVTASLVTSTVLLVVLASLVAAVHKVCCDATRIGPPGNIILTFISASAFFVPQRLGQVPFHLALALGTGVLAWLVCMAPALVRPHGPERIAVARALEAAAALLHAEERNVGDEMSGRGGKARGGGGGGGGVRGARGVAAGLGGGRGAGHADGEESPVYAGAVHAAPMRAAPVRAEPAQAGVGHEGEGHEGVARAGGGEASGAHAGVAQARHGAAAAVNAAWHTLFLVPARTPEKAANRAALERLLVRAESALGRESALRRESALGTESAPAGGGAAAPAGGGATAAEWLGRVAEGQRLGGWARALRSGRSMPQVTLSAAEAEEWAGVAAEGTAVVGDEGAAVVRDEGAAGLRLPAQRASRGLSAVRAVWAQLAPGSPLLPIGARVAVGCVLAGWASMGVGVGHPYWAVVTAASIYQANTTLSWQRALQRTLGNLLGLLLFTVLLPLIHTGQLAMIGLALAFQLGAEACITRNYWLGSVCVTPMALLLTEFGNPLPAHTLIADRWIDTVVGAAVGVACCMLVPNRRAADRIECALERVVAAESAGRELLAHASEPSSRAVDGDDVRKLGRARGRLAEGLVELREAVEVASGEWWQHALPEERITRAEQQGHRTLAGLVRALSGPASVSAQASTATSSATFAVTSGPVHASAST